MSPRLHFALVSARKDLRRRLADPAALAIWLGIPVLLGGLMMLPFGGGGATPRVRVLLADLDQSFLSGLVARAGGGESPLEIEEVALETGRARLDAGEAAALLVLPEGFGEAVLREEPLALELVTNPAQTIGPEIVRTSLELLLEAVFYAHRLLGPELRELQDDPPAGADLRAAAIATRIERRVRSLEGTLFPPVLSVRFGDGDEPAAEAVPERASGGVGLLFLPGILFLALAFIAQGMSDDLWRERDQGTLRRALVAPQGLAPFLAGKLGAGAAIMAGAALAGLAVSAAAFGVPWSALPGALLWSTFAGISLLCLFLWLQLLASTQRGASVLGSAVLFPLVMVGGSFLPFEALPEWMRSVGSWTPNGRGVLVLRDVMRGELELAQLGLGVLVVALPGTLAFLLALRRLRTRFVAA